MLNTEQLAKLKALLDNGTITQEEYEAEKEKLLRENSNQRLAARSRSVLTIVAVAILVVVFLSLISSLLASFGEKTSSSSEIPVSQNAPLQTQSPSESQNSQRFAEPCPVSVTADVSDNIINFPELHCNITNLTDATITAVQLYFVPVDVYGEESDDLFSINKLYTDTPISPGSSDQCSWQLLDQSVKKGTVYVYSVYFEDGTEWGNKDEVVSEIKKYGYRVEVSG